MFIEATHMNVVFFLMGEVWVRNDEMENRLPVFF